MSWPCTRGTTVAAPPFAGTAPCSSYLLTAPLKTFKEAYLVCSSEQNQIISKISSLLPHFLPRMPSRQPAVLTPYPRESQPSRFAPPVVSWCHPGRNWDFTLHALHTLFLTKLNVPILPLQSLRISVISGARVAPAMTLEAAQCPPRRAKTDWCRRRCCCLWWGRQQQWRSTRAGRGFTLHVLLFTISKVGNELHFERQNCKQKANHSSQDYDDAVEEAAQDRRQRGHHLYWSASSGRFLPSR